MYLLLLFIKISPAYHSVNVSIIPRGDCGAVRTMPWGCPLATGTKRLIRFGRGA